MDIFPVWRTTYYDTVEDSITFRITNDDGEEIYRARADRRPDEDIMRINLNKPCQNALDSMLSGWNGETDVVVPQNAYMVFHLQFPDGDGWETVYSFAFVNDWSYEDHQGNEYSEPINGHARKGQILPYSYLVTGDSETICYEELIHIIFYLTSGDGATFNVLGGTWTMTYVTNLETVFYETSWGATGYTSGGTLSVEVDSGDSATVFTKYYDEPGGILLKTARAQRTGTFADLYLTLGIRSGGTVTVVTYDSVERTLHYSKDGGITWASITPPIGDISGAAINVSAGENVMFKANYSAYTVWNGSGIIQTGTYFNGGTSVYDVFGNILSIVYGDSFRNYNSPAAERAFYRFFANTSIRSAKNLVLPSVGLTNDCYSNMFFRSTLTEAPKLGALTLAAGCYGSMFHDCTSLREAPELPATVIKQGAYRQMFQGCTSITGHTFSASQIEDYGCTAMYSGCTALTGFTGTFSDGVPGVGAFAWMFRGCTALRTVPTISAYEVTSGACFCMFAECTSLVTAPEMADIETCGKNGMEGMFEGCTSLLNPPTKMPYEIDTGSLSAMFSGCTSLVTAPELPALYGAAEGYAWMFNGCTSLRYIKCLAISVSDTRATYNWVGGVPAGGTFVKNPSMTGWGSGDSGIPSGWTVVNNS